MNRANLNCIYLVYLKIKANFRFIKTFDYFVNVLEATI